MKCLKPSKNNPYQFTSEKANVHYNLQYNFDESAIHIKPGICHYMLAFPQAKLLASLAVEPPVSFSL